MTQVTVTLDRAHYQTHVTSGKHVIWADEPRDNGGQDEGMEPFELLLASLGSCTAITVRMYADRKQWPLDKIRIALKLAQDKDKKLTRIHKRIELKGSLSPEQRARLMEIADRCPVHRVLLNPLEITSELLETPAGGKKE
jgi:putative redox protein